MKNNLIIRCTRNPWAQYFIVNTISASTYLIETLIGKSQQQGYGQTILNYSCSWSNIKILVHNSDMLEGVSACGSLPISD